jgi:hypothetical protein
MRVLAVIIFCLLAARPALSQGTAALSPAASEEAAIRAIVARYVDAREKRDAKRLEALFTADANAAAPRRMRTTLVVVRSAEGTPANNDWRIAAIRNMAPTDPAR